MNNLHPKICSVETVKRQLLTQIKKYENKINKLFYMLLSEQGNKNRYKRYKFLGNVLTCISFIAIFIDLSQRSRHHDVTVKFVLTNVIQLSCNLQDPLARLRRITKQSLGRTIEHEDSAAHRGPTDRQGEWRRVRKWDYMYLVCTQTTTNN